MRLAGFGFRPTAYRVTEMLLCRLSGGFFNNPIVIMRLKGDVL